jgi:NAD(P)-dependent dehydrogenase (short-subunit alcohol dehydrogenase family)
MSGFDLTSRTALVTGSARGIGRSIALRLAQAGASVAFHGRTQSAELESAVRGASGPGHATMIVGDLEEIDTVPAAIVERAVAELGGLDILVNNAGMLSPAQALETSLEDWNRTLAVNLTAAFLCSQAAAGHMRQAGYGRIVNVASQIAEVGLPGYTAYGVAKAGLNQLTRQLAVELAPYGITVNSVAPAFVATEMAEAAFRELPDLYQDQLARVPKRRMCKVEEVAAAVHYLVSTEADFTTGSVLHVDGGYLAL